jgi:hypothetical protein
MATVTVSNSSQLKSALTSAKGDTTIVLEGGDYGTLNINGNSPSYKFSDLTITSKSNSKPAVFTDVNLSNVDDVTFEGIKFDYSSKSDSPKPFVFNNTKNVSIVNSEVDGMLSGGHGSGHGLWVKGSSDFLVKNTDFLAFAKAFYAYSSSDVQVIDNSFTGIAVDGMIFSRIDGALIEGNSVEMEGRTGTAHRDMIQFFNDHANEISRDIVIRGNVLESHETVTHGIYMANEEARRTGDLDDYYRNITIEKNTVKSGQVLGIAVGEAVGVKIAGNTVVQGSDIGSSKAVDVPVILVDHDARQVSITGNTTHKLPAAAGANWQPGDYKTSGWTISGNKIVALGTDAGSSSAGSGSGGSVSKPVAPVDPVDGNGSADVFRYNGQNVDGKKTTTFSGVDFKEGDTIVLTKFDAGTFHHHAGGNPMAISSDKSYAKLNSLTDIQELVDASKDLSAIFQKDTLILRVAQDDGTLDIALPGFADDYKATLSDALL